MSLEIFKLAIPLRFAEDIDLKYECFAFIQKVNSSKYFHADQSVVNDKHGKPLKV